MDPRGCRNLSPLSQDQTWFTKQDLTTKKKLFGFRQKIFCICFHKQLNRQRLLFGPNSLTRAVQKKTTHQGQIFHTKFVNEMTRLEGQEHFGRSPLGVDSFFCPKIAATPPDPERKHTHIQTYTVYCLEYVTKGNFIAKVPYLLTVGTLWYLRYSCMPQFAPLLLLSCKTEVNMAMMQTTHENMGTLGRREYGRDREHSDPLQPTGWSGFHLL